MQWIKSHLTIVVCGAVSLASIVLIVLGILLCDVTEVMGRDRSLVQSLGPGQIQPVNQSVLNHLHAVLDSNTQKVEETFKKLAALGAHEPLDEDLFPQPVNQAVPFQFRGLYFKAQQQMFEELHAGDRPTPEEIEQEAAEMAAERLRAQSMEELGLSGRGGETTDVRRPETERSRFGSSSSPKIGAWKDQEQMANMTPEQMAAEVPAVRLSIRRARSIYCYANAESFDQRPVVLYFDRPPPVDEFWYAQMALWIQQDVVKALAALNDRVAEGLKSRDEDPWVGTLPVKHLQWLAVGGYLPQQSGALESQASGRGGTDVVATGMAFTQRVGSETVDVMRFSLGLVVEASMLPSVIDEICKAGFYTPILVQYEVVPPTTSLEGYIYGPGPSIQAELQFEGCFLRNKYDKWMPESVKQAIREGRAIGETAVRSRSGLDRTGSSGGGGGVPSSDDTLLNR